MAQIAVVIKKEVNSPDWYPRVLMKTTKVKYYNVTSYYILKP